MSKAEYAVKEGKVLSVTVELTFDEILNEFTSAEYSYKAKSALLGKIQERVAGALADQFILAHANEVLAQIDPAKVANMVTLKTLDRLGGSREPR